MSLYPAGSQQASLRLPSLLLRVKADELTPAVMDAISAALTAGATGVILEEGQTAAAGMFAACLQLKGITQDRAVLLVEDRTDLAVATEADGVLLTSQKGELKAACKHIPCSSS
jgi:thiamine monophosphate synthase